MGSLTHLRRLTDDFGVWQHTKGEDIDRVHGYALDDAARALIVYLAHGDKRGAAACLHFILRALQANKTVVFFDQNRRPVRGRESTDAHALAVWALATAKQQGFETELCLEALNKVKFKPSPHLRTTAYLLLAACALGDKLAAVQLSQKLLEAFDRRLGWFEQWLTYANAAIPLALLHYRQTFAKRVKTLDDCIKTALDTLENYNRIGAIPAPVGNRLWQRLGALERDVYGQQPVDAGFMVMALSEAYLAFNQTSHLQAATDWMDWFYGNNIYKRSLVSDNGACADGLDAPDHHKDGSGVSPNQGAESTIMYLLARKAFDRLPPGKNR